MEKKTSNLLNRPLYVYLYGIAFLFFKASAYLPSFQLLQMLSCIVVYSLVSYSMILGFRKLTNPIYAGIPVMICWISLLHVVGTAQVFGYAYAYIPYRFYVIFYLCCIVLLIVCCRILKNIPAGLAPMLNRVMNIFFLITICVFSINGLRRDYYRKTEEQIHFHYNTVIRAGKVSADIVWLLMDEYGSSQSLKQQFGFINPLDSQLKQNKFILLPDIKTRFGNTLFSVNSIFNMDDTMAPSSYYEGIDLLRHGSFIPVLERSGYQFVNLGFFDLAEHPMLADRSGYPYNYFQQLSSGTLFYMIYNRWKSTVLKTDTYNNDVIKHLWEVLSATSSQPRFIWAHLTIPHEPFCRDENGKLLSDTAFSANDSVAMKRRYIAYAGYGNTLILSLIKKVKRKTIFIITGDHGPRYPFLEKKQYITSPYAAIYIPEIFDTAKLLHLKYISQLPAFLLNRHSENLSPAMH